MASGWLPLAGKRQKLAAGHGPPATERKRMSTGKIVQIIGPVVDVEFPPDRLPAIYNALKIRRGSNGDSEEITAEVAQHLGESTYVR